MVSPTAINESFPLGTGSTELPAHPYQACDLKQLKNDCSSTRPRKGSLSRGHSGPVPVPNTRADPLSPKDAVVLSISGGSDSPDPHDDLSPHDFLTSRGISPAQLGPGNLGLPVTWSCGPIRIMLNYKTAFYNLPYVG